MDQFFLDTNIVIRFLTNDDEVQSPFAYKLFEKATNGELVFYFSPLIIAECCWMLQSTRYGYSKEEISKQLMIMIQTRGIKVEEKDIITEALKNYSEQNVDFVDAYSASHAKSTQVTKVTTWNKKHFNRLNVEFYAPEDILND